MLPVPPRPTGNVFAISIDALRMASRSLVFWVLTFTFFVCGISSFGLTPHFVTLCGDFGINPMTSTTLLAAVGVFDLFGTLGSGWLADRFDNRWLLVGYFGFRGLSLIWLPYSGFSLVGLSLFAMFYGLDFIATVPPTVRLTAQAFGREQAPLVFGWIYAAHQLGAGLMAFAAGISRDLLASYLPAFFVAGAAVHRRRIVVLVAERAQRPDGSGASIRLTTCIAGGRQHRRPPALRASIIATRCASHPRETTSRHRVQTASR